MAAQWAKRAIFLQMTTTQQKKDTLLISSYGVHDLNLFDMNKVKRRIDRYISTAEKDAKGSPVGILSLPPQRNDAQNRKVREMNMYLQDTCNKSQNVKYIRTNLGLSDVKRDGIQATQSGKVKIARAIAQFATNCRRSQSKDRI